MARPSRDHSKAATSIFSPVSAAASPPPSGSTQSLFFGPSLGTSPLARAERKASRRPSGEKRGRESSASAVVRRSGSPPAKGTRHRLAHGGPGLASGVRQRE